MYPERSKTILKRKKSASENLSEVVYMKDKSIAIITARGGSKRIPRKNIREFCGSPIISYSIKAAIDSNLFDEVMVSTDDEEIKTIALKYGASVPFMRSSNTANDFANTYEVLLEVLENYSKQGRHFKYLCCIYPTAPFITVSKLNNAMNLLEKSCVDTVFPVVPYSFPPQRGLVIENENVFFKWPENALKRSQDLETLYHDSGQFYCININSFMKSKKIIMDNAKPIIVDEMEVQDIDNENDWKLAEIKYQMMKTKGIIND